MIEATFPSYNKELLALNEKMEKFFKECEKNRENQLQTIDVNKKSALLQIEKNIEDLAKVKQEIRQMISSSHQVTMDQYEVLAKKFEETAIQLSPDKQMLYGVQEFLNLVRSNLFKEGK